MAIAPAFALGEGNRNILLIVVMTISPILLFLYPQMTPRVDLPLFLVLSMMIGFPILFHPETMRWSTILYSCMFCLYFIGYCRFLRSTHYKKEDFLKLLRFLIFAYSIVLVIQQFCVLTGLPIFNISNYEPESPWKLNSLTAEPSHSARILPLIMYIYVCTKMSIDGYTFKKSFKEDKMVWYAFLWSVLTMGSATAYLFLSFVFLKFFSVRKLLRSTKIIIVCVIMLTLVSQTEAFQRFYAMAQVAYTMDPNLLMEADHSGSVRIVPSILAFKKIGVSSANDWFGYGVDADQNIVDKMSGVENAGGGLFTMWLNYGVMVCFCFWLFTFIICRVKNDIVSVLFWFFCVVMYGGINNQIIWLTLILLYTYKQLNKQSQYGHMTRVKRSKGACV